MSKTHHPFDDHPVTSSGGAVAAQRGFDYQLDVSVLAALKLLIISNSTATITLESATEEDMEADILEDEPGCVTPVANVVGNIRLIVQVKLSNGNPWSIADLKRLLNHGKRRKSASNYLADPRVRYLLVTSADAAGEARNLLVDEFLERPDVAGFPKSLLDVLPKAPEGRVAIWGQLSERRLYLEIQDVFTLLLVPQAKRDACLLILRAEAKTRMLGAYSGAWMREEVLETIRQHDGSWGTNEKSNKFVAPSNFNEIEEVFNRKNAVVITGRSGIGKTYAALALCDMARKSEPTLDVITIDSSLSPSSVRRFPESSITLLYVEDPWGQYSLLSGADAWTAQLPGLLRAARAGQRYIITSRSDMLTSAGAMEALKPWMVELDARNYVNGGLERIYENNMQLLQPHLQLKALEFQTDVMERLDTPLELDLYFSLLMRGPESGEVDPAFLSRVLALSHREAVEDVVLQYLRAMSDKRAPAQIWALMAARGVFDRNQLATVQRRLRQLDHTLAGTLEKATDLLIATRHLRQPAALISFSHPSVRAGFEVFIKSNWSECEYAFEQLVSSLISLPEQMNAWGIETAARVVAEVRELVTAVPQSPYGFHPDDTSQVKINTWLEAALLDEKVEFSPLLLLASKSGSNASIPCEIARWFLRGYRRGGEVFNENWKPVEFDQAWYERVYADGRSALIAARFIRDQLPWDDGDYGNEFPAQLSRIAVGLEAAFIDAAHSLIGAGPSRMADLIARQAVHDLKEYHGVVDASLDDLRPELLHDVAQKSVHLQIADGEVDEAEKDYYEDYFDDSNMVSANFVEVYVEERRNAGAWHELASHPRVSEFAHQWAQCALNGSVQPDEAEVLALFYATRNAGCEDAAWNVACKYWLPSLKGELVDQILRFAEDDRLRWAAIRCACKTSSVALKNCFQYLSPVPASFVRLIVDVHDAMAYEEDERVRVILEAEGSVVLEIYDALCSKECEKRKLGNDARELLSTAMEQACAYVVTSIAPILIENDAYSRNVLRQWRVAATDPADAKASVIATIKLGDFDGVKEALKHVRADARQVALEYLASAGEVPLASDLLALAKDPGSQVRLSLIRILTEKPHPAHFAMLMQLITDKWDNSSPRYNEPPAYMIAQNAMRALASYSLLPNEAGNKLIRLAAETKDPTLRCLSFQIAAQNCSALIQESIWHIVQSESAPHSRLAAVDALALAPRLDSSVLEQISHQSLNGHPPLLAVSLVRLISRHLEIGEVLIRLGQLSQQSSQRVLLVVGMVYLRERDYSAAEQVCRLLGKDHPVCSLLNTPKKKLPCRVLDDLGDVRLRKAVQTRMAKLFRRS